MNFIVQMLIFPLILNQDSLQIKILRFYNIFRTKISTNQNLLENLPHLQLIK